QGRPGGGRGEGDVAAVDEQEAAEEEGLDVRTRVEDVAGEDHPGGEAGDEHDRDDGVRALPAPAEGGVAGAEGEGRRERPERTSEADAVGEDEAREGGGPDRVREEGKAAEDYPGAEKSGRHREDEDLGQAALHEWELEGLEQGSISLMRMSLV